MSKNSVHVVNLRGIRSLWLIFSIFVVYGTLIPFNLCLNKEQIILNISNIVWIPFIDPDGTRASIPDTVQNILFFLPFGFLGFFCIKRNTLMRIFIVTVLGGLLSSIVEVLQVFTIDRSTSLSDVVINTAGSIFGALSAYLFSTFFEITIFSRLQKYDNVETFFPIVVALIIVAAGALQPFDFTLDVGGLMAKVKSLVHNPTNFSSNFRDEGVVFFRFFIFAYISVLHCHETGKKYPLMKGIALTSLTGLFLEACQIIVGSRMPNVQDGLVILFGSLCGGFFIHFWNRNLSPVIWCIILAFATLITAGVQALSPFHVVTEYRNFNWFPFLPYYERTTFIALSNFIESALVYFPMGFMMAYILSYVKHFTIFIGIIAAGIAFSLEFMQGWIEGRYPDITDVLGALTGAMIGSWTCSEGWVAFDKFVESK